MKSTATAALIRMITRPLLLFSVLLVVATTNVAIVFAEGEGSRGGVLGRHGHASTTTMVKVVRRKRTPSLLPSRKVSVARKLQSSSSLHATTKNNRKLKLKKSEKTTKSPTASPVHSTTKKPKSHYTTAAPTKAPPMWMSSKSPTSQKDEESFPIVLLNDTEVYLPDQDGMTVLPLNPTETLHEDEKGDPDDTKGNGTLALNATGTLQDLDNGTQALNSTDIPSGSSPSSSAKGSMSMSYASFLLHAISSLAMFFTLI